MTGLTHDPGIKQPPMQSSPSLMNLALALSGAQAAMRPATKDAFNPHFKSKYADLASVWESCRAPLTSNGLCVSQLVTTNGTAVTVTTLLLHKSGEWLASDLTMTSRDNSPQGLTSCATYGRRVGLSAMVGVCSDDDDGNQSSTTKESYAPPTSNQNGPGPKVHAQVAAPATIAEIAAPKLTDTQRYNVACAMIRKKLGDTAGNALIESISLKHRGAALNVPEDKRADFLREIESTAKGEAK